MLTLEKIRKKDNMVYTDFFFVGNNEKGHAIYDVSRKEIVSASYGEKNPLVDFVYGFGYVKKLIEMMVAENSFPQTITYEWY